MVDGVHPARLHLLCLGKDVNVQVPPYVHVESECGLQGGLSQPCPTHQPRCGYITLLALGIMGSTRS